MSSARTALLVPFLVALLAFWTGGCSSPQVVTEVVTVEKPVPVPCRAPEVVVPIWAVDTVELTGDPEKDLVLIERAKEAELEQRRAYEAALEAAVRACQ